MLETVRAKAEAVKKHNVELKNHVCAKESLAAMVSACVKVLSQELPQFKLELAAICVENLN